MLQGAYGRFGRGCPSITDIPPGLDGGVGPCEKSLTFNDPNPSSVPSPGGNMAGAQVAIGDSIHGENLTGTDSGPDGWSTTIAEGLSE